MVDPALAAESEYVSFLALKSSVYIRETITCS
jgi:hypothetical protein